MLRLLDGIAAEHPRAVACPPEGELREVVRRHGVEQFDLPGTDVSLRLHPVETPRGLLSMVRSALALRRVARRFGAEVIHANSVRAGLIAVLTRRLGGPPVVVQCHDHLPRSRAGELSRRAVAGGADEVVAVTDTTAAHFNAGLPRPKARRVYISFNHELFNPGAGAAGGVHEELGLGPDTPLLAHVAQISPWKGQDTAIRALAEIRRHHDAHLLVVGETAFSSQRFDNAGFRDSLVRLTAELGLGEAVHFLGQRDDVPRLMGAAEMLLLPSWDEPFGLVVAEAMAVGLPVLVTENGGVKEYVRDGVNGRLLPPSDPAAWAAAAVDLLGDRARLDRMREENVRTVAQFSDERYASEMLDTYRRAARA